MLAELQKGIQAQSAEERSAALESLVTILETRGHELSPEGLDEFADVLTQILRSLPASHANKSAARLTQVLVAQTESRKTDPEAYAVAPEDDEPIVASPDTPDMQQDNALDSAAILNSLIAPILAEAEQGNIDTPAASTLHLDMLMRAAQPHVDAMTTHMIVSRGHDAARIAVAQNPGAVFARSTLTTLTELAISDLTLKNALAARHDLPEAIADRLWPFLSENSKVTLLTARRSETLDDYEALADEERDETHGLLTAVFEQQIRDDQTRLQDAIAQLAGDGRIITIGLLLARFANVAPLCGVHVILSPAERPLVMMLKTVKACAASLADIIRLRARCGIGASKDSRFAAIVMDGIAHDEAQKLTRLMSERLEQIKTPRTNQHAA